ncbi:hypothetical protein ACH4NV_34200 [Streptomyces althioticus]|uniref:hypothetical protein n=1 Tax=Streptomyces althioticus TaxID=83380 RepID=UPI003791842B
MSNAYVEPVAAVPKSHPSPVEELGRQWHREAAGKQMVAEDGRFLILLSGPGASTRGWLCVKDPVGSNLPARILSVSESIEFIVMSLDGRRICATSEEDEEYWVVFEEVCPL